MSCTLTQVIAARLSGLAELLTRNAEMLTGSGLPEAVTGVRAAVYADVAAQLLLRAETDPQTADNPLVAATPVDDATATAGVAGEFETLAGLLAANARLLTRRTADAVMHRRAGVYRDVAAQLRMLAADERQAAVTTAPRPNRAPLSNTAPVNPIAAKAADRAPRVRPEFLDALVSAIAARRRTGWSVARLTLWLRTQLRDPQTDHVHPCAQRSFVAYVTGLLGSPQTAALAA
ncbi:hypothetical protein [Amycolatopsis sp. La24]|uniref:hypothetical protein n=1 Tax=Amycolatopsis sp. La24 TaxID=3028304 RepID=UPI0023B1BF15|nr:hypothetical protein [Amycolatopsis sp. La24]